MCRAVKEYNYYERTYPGTKNVVLKIKPQQIVPMISESQSLMKELQLDTKLSDSPVLGKTERLIGYCDYLTVIQNT